MTSTSRINRDLGPGTLVECPRCRYTMEALSASAAMHENLSVGLDGGSLFMHPGGLGTPSIGQWITEFFFGWMGFSSKSRYQRVLHHYPNTLICMHCRHLIKRE